MSVIHVESRPEALRLHFRGRRIIEHTPDAPALALGEGVPSIRRSRDHYSVHEQLTRRVAASRWEVREALAGRAAITFPGLLTLIAEGRGGALELRFEDVDPRYNRLWLSICAGPRERVYGYAPRGGEELSALDLRGRRLPIWAALPGAAPERGLLARLAELRAGAGGDGRAAHLAEPTFVSSDNLSCHADATAYAELDLRDERRHTLYLWQIPARVRVDVDESAPALLGRLSASLDREPELPAWTHEGAWITARGGAARVEEKLRRARARGARVAAVWAPDWQGVRTTGKELLWNWRYDRGLYPNLAELTARLAGEGVRFLGYINPMLVPEGDLYHQAEERGYLVRDRAGRILHVTRGSFPAALVDLDSPEAARWYRGVIRDNLIDAGLSGWLADLGETLPADAALASGRTGLEAHNDYPAQWARLNRQAVEEAGKTGEIAVFSRASVARPAQRSKELFLRACEQAAFTPVLCTGEDAFPFDTDDDTLAHFARLTRVHAHLGPYHRALGREHAEAGLPPIRRPYLHHERDDALHGLPDQYLYGRDLLVAPVLGPRRASRRVYLPDDEWIHAWTGRVYGRGFREVAAPVGSPPVFYRASSPFRSLFDGLRGIR